MPKPEADLRREPWEWRESSGVWRLAREQGAGTILCASVGEGHLPVLLVRHVPENGRLVPLTPAHPIARAIAGFPALFKIVANLAESPTRNGERREVDAARAAIVAIGEWEEARGAAD